MPSIDPILLIIFSFLHSVNNERMVNQNGIRTKAITISATENNVFEIEFNSPFLATTAPKSLK